MKLKVHDINCSVKMKLELKNNEGKKYIQFVAQL